jgi:hypothetical protein
MASALRIGIDFDNTIITYDEVFRATARSCGLVDTEFTGNKQALRDAIRLLPDGELAWQRLQGEVYGKGIARASMLEGAEAFLRRCRAEGCAVAIVSHKSLHGAQDPDRIDLREVALDWMAAQNLFGAELGIGRADVYFENTRADKLRRIASLRLSHFIDDLEEVLSDPDFPPGVKRILLSNAHRQPCIGYTACATWREIEKQVFADA